MQRWHDLRERVLAHVAELQGQLPDAVARGDTVSAFGLARDLEGAIMAVGLEDAARLAAGLLPILARPGTQPEDVSRLLAKVRREVARAQEHPQPLPVLGARVLVVDDDPITRQVLQHILSGAGCDVVLARNLREARGALRGPPLQAVIVDLHLPDGQGTTLVQEVRDDARLRLLPMLLLTGDADGAALRDAYAAGADDFLVKPVRASDLALRLGFLLRKAALHANAAVRMDKRG